MNICGWVATVLMCGALSRPLRSRFWGSRTEVATDPDEKKGFAVHGETHRSERMGRLRAATLGANDGLIFTSSLVVGMAAAQSSQAAVFSRPSRVSPPALSMAAGEYVSVSSQADAEKADLTREGGELVDFPVAEHAELAEICVARGLDIRSSRSRSRSS